MSFRDPAGGFNSARTIPGFKGIGQLRQEYRVGRLDRLLLEE